MALPFLPGNVFDTKIGKEKFHKSHYLEKKFGIGHLYYDNKPGIGGEPLPGQRIDPPTSIYPEGHGSKVPAWIAFDKKVLSFDAYFQQAVNESRTEQYRVRKCQIFFYLEDDTIQVVEPRVKNSALPQGTILRRHRIRKPAPNDACFYTVHDFNVGMDLEMYGRVYRLVACDPFTANFLRKLGVRVNEPEPVPDDPYTLHRLSIDESMQPRRPFERVDKLRQFLDHDRHVLRFYCFWDDTDNLFGDTRDFVLHYFLADDTIEIYERISANSGREAIPCFLRRQKLPKSIPPLPPPGAAEGKAGIYNANSSKACSQDPGYYTERDLTLGAFLNVYGRKFLICDCDEFTKEFYRKKYGITTFIPATPSRGQCNYVVKQENPPYNGWGSDEDSLMNCYNLIPTAPRKILERNCIPDVLRFVARPADDSHFKGTWGDGQVNCSRRFIISCYLRDHSFMVYEPPITNSGFKGGKFMERRRVMKPGQPRFRTHLPAYYTPSDIYLGGHMVFNNFVFEVYGADEHTLAYMEAHPAEFPLADVQKILQRLRPVAKGCEEKIRRLVSQADPNSSGSVDFDKFGCLLLEILKVSGESPVVLENHEIVTLARHYALKVPKETNYMAMVGIAQHHLRRAPFEAFQELLDACRQEDFENTKTIELGTLRRICKANRLPLPDDILLALMEISQNIDNGMVYYENFINRLNWRCNPLPAGTVPCEYSGNLEVDWSKFLQVGEKVKREGKDCLNIFDTFGVERVRHVTFVEDLVNLAKCN